MYSRAFLKKSSVFILALFLSIGAFACEINFKVSENNKKSAYTAGETIVVECTVTLSHRNCTAQMSDLKFDTKGCKIAGATKWEQVSPGVYSRKLKVLMDSSGADKAQIICQRSCDKEGGYGKIVLPLKS